MSFLKIIFLGFFLIFILFGCEKKNPESFSTPKKENSYLKNFQLKKNGFFLSSDIAVFDKKKEKITLENIKLKLDKEIKLKAKNGIYSIKENSFSLKKIEISTAKNEKLITEELKYFPGQKLISGEKAIFFYRKQKIKAESFIFDHKYQKFEMNKAKAEIWLKL